MSGEAEPSDEALMERYVEQGDRRAFEEIFSRYSGRLMALFMRSVGDDTLSQDLLQQTFLHVHRARRDFKQGRPLRPWIYTIALNLRREHFRRRGRKPETSYDPVAHGEPSVDPSVTSPRDRAVRLALMELPDSQREVIVLHWYEEMTFSEIADLVGASLSAVKVRAHRGYNKLREILGDEASGK